MVLNVFSQNSLPVSLPLSLPALEQTPPCVIRWGSNYVGGVAGSEPSTFSLLPFSFQNHNARRLRLRGWFFCSHPPLTLVESMLDMTGTMLYLTDPLTFCISLTSSPTTQRLTVTTVRGLRGTSPQGRFSRAAPSENFARLRVGSLGCPVSSEAFALTGSGLSGAAGLF